MNRQHGTITAAGARSVGMTAATIWRRVQSGTWVRCERGTYRHAAHPDTWRSQLMVACLATNGVASHRSAAALWQIDGFREGITEVVSAKSASRRRRSFRLHESKQMSIADARTIDSIPVTGPSRTLLDLSSLVGRKRLDTALDDLLRRELVTWPQLYATLIRHARQGRNGVVRFRSLLESRSAEDAIPRSAWSRMVADLLVDEGLPRPLLEFRICDDEGRFVAEVDLAYPGEGVVIELDSVRWHLNRESFHRDPRRRNRLTALGYDVYNFTWSDFKDHPAELCRIVTEATGSGCNGSLMRDLRQKIREVDE